MALQSYNTIYSFLNGINISPYYLITRRDASNNVANVYNGKYLFGKNDDGIIYYLPVSSTPFNIGNITQSDALSAAFIIELKPSATPIVTATVASTPSATDATSATITPSSTPSMSVTPSVTSTPSDITTASPSIGTVIIRLRTTVEKSKVLSNKLVVALLKSRNKNSFQTGTPAVLESVDIKKLNDKDRGSKLKTAKGVLTFLNISYDEPYQFTNADGSVIYKITPKIDLATDQKILNVTISAPGTTPNTRISNTYTYSNNIETPPSVSVVVDSSKITFTVGSLVSTCEPNDPSTTPPSLTIDPKPSIIPISDDTVSTSSVAIDTLPPVTPSVTPSVTPAVTPASNVIETLNTVLRNTSLLTTSEQLITSVKYALLDSGVSIANTNDVVNQLTLANKTSSTGTVASTLLTTLKGIPSTSSSTYVAFVINDSISKLADASATPTTTTAPADSIIDTIQNKSGGVILFGILAIGVAFVIFALYKANKTPPTPPTPAAN